MLVAWGAFAMTAAANEGLEPWASRARPTDVPKRHVEIVSSAEHRYSIMQGGTVDGSNCRGPMGVGMQREGAFEQVWESNRAVKLENVGETDVVNPWLSNGRNDFRNVDAIVAAALEPGMTDREKAKALWFQQVRHRYHRAGETGKELGDPVKVFNVYGHNPCGCDANMMGGLWRRAGLKGAPVRLVSHSIAQVFYDGGWHVMDGDLAGIYLLRDNETLASDIELARDHDLVKRTHNQGIMLPDSRDTDERAAAMFVSEAPISGSRDCYASSMNMTLRPGEALTWRWGHVRPAKFRGPANVNPTYPDTVCNGLWEYRPDFSKPFWPNGAESVEHVRVDAEGIGAEPGKRGRIVWAIRSPYVFLGGRLEVEGCGASFELSWDGKTWEPAGESMGAFFADGKACYAYRLRCTLSGTARLKRLAIVNDVQMAPLALPEMRVGENVFVYSDQSPPGPATVRITHEWVERSDSKPPPAPVRAVFPSDAGESGGTDIVFRWEPSQDPDGAKIADYHFELSDDPRMRWPLSPNFYKLVSRSPDTGKAQYTLPHAGLLTPGRTYYWHVRAKNEQGVWGPWSKTWRFTAGGPGHPLDVTVAYDADTHAGTLRWQPNPVGRPPVAYRVYGSDERGFSISDTPYTIVVGRSKEVSAQQAANFMAETAATELAVLGPHIALPAGNKVYYRVVAVDARGTRSGPSDYAEAPRPIIFSTPVPKGEVGAEYRYRVCATRSLGDLRVRIVNNNMRFGFWDVETPVYAIKRGPDWLAIDPATGLLSGTPDAAGPVDVVVTATIAREVRRLDDTMLGWGHEKVVGTTLERVGRSTQAFVLDVAGGR
ncbi:MAG: putative Ig domain-containing protein [Kiritimatiellae bacterium]|nr:putative Ig domain-containing protein [Kiritimatiellia bacterium]